MRDRGGAKNTVPFWNHNMAEFAFPISGYHKGLPSSKQPLLTSPDLNNMRPMDAKTGRITGAQRPGLSKRFSQQIASVAGPVVAIVSVASPVSP